MHIRHIFCLSAFLLNISVFAGPPDIENFAISGIHFGDSVGQVKAVVNILNLKPVGAAEYQAYGNLPNALAYQEFGNTCLECRIRRDPRYETLEVQYSRISGRVVAISRTLMFDKPVLKEAMQKTIIERFGRETSSLNNDHVFSYAWRKNGRLERPYEQDQHCGGRSLPALQRAKNCGLSALFSFDVAKDNEELVVSQHLQVFDLASYDEEMAVAEQSAMDRKSKELEDSKTRNIPRF